jgi:hypothetical protein
MVTPGVPEETQAELDLPVNYDVNTELEAIEAASDPMAQLDTDDIAAPLLSAEEVTEAPEAPVELPPEVVEPAPDVPTSPAPAPPPPPEAVSPIAQPEVQQQLAWYQQQHQQAQMQRYQEEVAKAEEAYRERLLDDGFMPDQAKRLASEARQQAEHQQALQAQHQQQLQFEQGRYNAARHYARHYKLGINHLEELEKLPDPASMEREARRIAEIRDLRGKYEQVAKGRVAPAEYDSGASSAGASRSRERILDDYMEGRVNLTADQFNRLMSNN